MRRHLLSLPFLLPVPLCAQWCDSLEITSVRYAPFGDGLHATLHNGLSGFLSGPMFDMFDADGDTLVLNAFNFFGMGPNSAQMHQLPLLNNALLPGSPFTGSLVLNYYYADSSRSCVFLMDSVDLCPPEACPPLAVYAYLQGGLVETDLDWSVTDAENLMQASGVLHMDTLAFGYTIAELCLPPGTYTLHMQQEIPAGNSIQVGMTLAELGYSAGTNTQLPIGGSVDHEFGFYDLCAQVGQGIIAHGPVGPQVVLDGRVLRLSSTDGSALGQLVLLDGMGRTARMISTNSTTAQSDLNDLAAGTYILRSIDTTKVWPAQRFILH